MWRTLDNREDYSDPAHACIRQLDHNEMPISRTLQYRKVTKPLLERKRRARINRCLDELKDLMVGALQAEGDNVSKLEKADILELTVRYLHKLNSNNALNPLEDTHRFQAGFAHCVQETGQYLMAIPGVDLLVSQRLMAHLGSSIDRDVETNLSSSITTSNINNNNPTVPLSVQVPSLQRPYSPPVSPITPTLQAPSPQRHYSNGRQQALSSHRSLEYSRESSRDLLKSQQYVMSCTPSAQDLSKPLTGLLMPVKGMPVTSEPQIMWRPW